MKFQSRLIGHCTSKLIEKELIQLDVNELVQRLILFDTFILKSVRFRDLPSLLAIFGYEGLLTLLEAKALQLECGHLTTGARSDKAIQLSLNSFSFSIVSPADYKQFLSRCFASIEPETKLTKKQFIRLKKTIADNMVLPTENGGNESMIQLYNDIQSNSNIFLTLVAKRLSERLNTSTVLSEFNLKMNRIDSNIFECDNNLAEKFNLQPVEVHQLIQSAGLALGNLNLRIEEMKLYNALSGFSETEMSIFDNKVRFLLDDFLPGNLEKQMHRVCTINGFPDLSNIQDVKIDVEKLLEIRNTIECREFRMWLQSLDATSDAEIEERLTSLRARMGNLLTGNPARVIRFLLSALIGVVPGVGTITSLVIDSLDSFLLEKILPSDGPVSFISDMYPSIFQK